MNQQAFDALQQDVTALRGVVDGHVATIQQQADDLAAANQAIADITAANAAGPPANAANPINAPGQRDGVIDMDSTVGMKVFTRATAALLTLFTGSADLLETFLNELFQRAVLYGWITAIFQITTTDHGVLNMLRDYSRITMAEIRAMAEIYSATLPIATRASQAAAQLHAVLQCSLSPDLLVRVIARKTEYTFEIANQTYEDGVGMLKIVFNLVATDTRAKVAMLERNLSDAGMLAKMHELEYDIIKFHLWVNEQSNGLLRRGQPLRLLVSGLYECYKIVPDDAFATHAAQEQSKWEDSETPDLTNEQVMNKAENKYQTILQKGEWKVKSKKDEEIIALTARTRELEDKIATMSPKKKAKLDPVTPSASNGKSRGATGPGEKFEWKTIAPKDGESHEKRFEGKDYVYCPHHGRIKWVLKEGHAGGCRNAPKDTPTSATTPALKTSDEEIKDQVIKALTAVAAEAE
jgi:hypothetical protein